MTTRWQEVCEVLDTSETGTVVTMGRFVWTKKQASPKGVLWANTGYGGEFLGWFTTNVLSDYLILWEERLPWSTS